MSLFARLTLGCIAATILTLATQAILWPMGTPDRIAVQVSQAEGPLAKAQGEFAVRAWDAKGASAARSHLQALSEAGLDAWLVRSDRIVGLKPMPPAMNRTLSGASAEGLPWGTWVRPLSDGKTELVIQLARPAMAVQLTRLATFLAVPLMVCLLLSRWLSRPILRLQRASLALRSGDLTARAGKVGGFREATELAVVFDDFATRNQAMHEAQKRWLTDTSQQLRIPLNRVKTSLEAAAISEGSDRLNEAIREVAHLDEILASLVENASPVGRAEVPLQLLVQDLVDEPSLGSKAA